MKEELKRDQENFQNHLMLAQWINFISVIRDVFVYLIKRLLKYNKLAYCANPLLALY